MDRPEWMSRAKPVEAVTLDVGFLIADAFYYGPENGFSKEQFQQLREPLYAPKTQQYGQYLLSAELSESAAELIRYYRDVLRNVARHRKDIDQQSHYFWMRPIIYAGTEFVITFPWYDTWEDATPLLHALALPADGLLFNDLEQGWEFHAIAEGDRLFLRQGELDSGEEHLVIAVDRARLSGQVPAVRHRVGRLIRELSAALGRDYWSQSW